MVWKDWISNADLCQCFKHLLLLPSSSLNLEGHPATGRVMSHSSVTHSKIDNSHHHSSLSRACSTKEKHHGRLVTKHACDVPRHLSARISGHLLLTCDMLWVPRQQRVATKSGQHTFFLVRRSSALHRVSLDNNKQLWLWSDPRVPQNNLQSSYYLHQSFKKDEL